MTDLRKAAEMALEALEVATTPLAADRQEVLKAQQALRQALAQPEQDNETYGYAKRLAEAIWEKHYKKESPHWRPFHDVLGVLTQIDNMTCGLEKAQPEQEPVCDKDPYYCGYVRCQLGKVCKNTAPPKREWVGLTNKEVDAIRNNIFEKYKKALFVTRDVTSENDYSAFNFYRAIEEKLRIKND